MKKVRFYFVCIAFASLYFTVANAQIPVLAPPAQDQGLPYTHSARPWALAAIKNTTAIFVGGRYAYVNGYKIRLDTKDSINKMIALIKLPYNQ